MEKIGILIVNLGTPDRAERKDVKRYLSEFLMDGRVIDIPYWKRYLLVKGIIAPFRSKKVSKEYKKLWLAEGSPLKVHGVELVKKVKALFNEVRSDVEVELAMRYQNPSLEYALNKMKVKAVGRIVVFPLFPQYASATTGSIAQKVMRIVSEWEVIPSIDFVNDYHDAPEFINTFADKVRADLKKYQPDHVLLSYHGIPERHLENIKKQNTGLCNWPACNCSRYDQVQRFCYRSACYNTTSLIAERVGLKTDRFTTSFQSRLGRTPWIKPYTDEAIVSLAQKGIKRLLVVSPSFVADCLETTLEIGEQYRDLFIENGGEAFAFTESLNSDDKWAQAIVSLISIKLDG